MTAATRYIYSRFTRHEPSYRVKFREVVVGWVTRVDRDPCERPRWIARLQTDPLIVGKGRTRDAAVDNALDQVGGLG